MNLEDRIASLESELRSTRSSVRVLFAVLAVVIGSAVVGLTRFSGPDGQSVRASSFELVDEKGAKRGEWTATGTGARLSMFEDGPKPRVQIGVSDGEPNLVLIDTNGTPRTWLVVTKDGPTFSISDEHGSKLGEWKQNRGGMMLRLGDAKGRLRMDFSAAADGSSFSLRDDAGTSRITFGVPMEGRRGEPYFELADDTGKSRVLIGAVKSTAKDGTEVLCPESTLMLIGSDGQAYRLAK